MSENREPPPVSASEPPLLQPAGGEEAVFAAADGTRIRYMVWPPTEAGARGGVILLPGRSEFIEKYFETVQDLLDRGFWVAAMDWRGQGLSGRPLSNRHKNHLTSFAPMVDDLKRFLEELEVRGLARPWILLAHSLGAHVALRFLHDYPQWVDGVALSAPMTALTFRPLGKRLTGHLTRLAVAFGLGRHYAPLQTNYGARQRSGANMRLLTSDRRRFRAEHRWLAKNPDLALGGVTYGWLEAALASMAELNGPDYPEAIETPTLIAQAGADCLIDNSKQETFARRLANAEFLRIEGARHELLNERDEYRDRFLAAVDRRAEVWLPRKDDAKA